MNVCPVVQCFLCVGSQISFERYHIWFEHWVRGNCWKSSDAIYGCSLIWIWICVNLWDWNNWVFDEIRILALKRKKKLWIFNLKGVISGLNIRWGEIVENLRTPFMDILWYEFDFLSPFEIETIVFLLKFESWHWKEKKNILWSFNLGCQLSKTGVQVNLCKKLLLCII